MNAKVYAGTSSVPSFTKWAMDVARKYCEPGELGTPDKAPAYPRESATGKPEQATGPQAGCMMVINGWRPKTCGDGPNLMLTPR